MIANIVPACYDHRGSSLWTRHQNQSCPSPVGAFLVLEKLLIVIVVQLIFTGSSIRRLRTMIDLCIDKLALLDEQPILGHEPCGLGYVYDILQHGIAALIHVVLARFPFNTNTVNKWFRVPQEDVLSEMGVVHAINLDKAGRTERSYSPQYGVAFPNGLADDQHVLLFHGTSHEGAQGIMKEGIDLSNGTKKGDFSNGNGFYLTDDFNTAFEWADSRYNSYSKAAVLIFKFDKNRLGEYQGKDLRGQDARDEWEIVVRKCRNGEGLKKKALTDIMFIEGPMANISRANNKVTAVRHSYQLCILSDEMAESFDECLHSVVFHSST